MRSIFQFSLYIVLILSLFSCKSSTQYLSEGIIEYKVKFKDVENHMVSAMLPNKMRMEFKDSKVRMELKAFTGSISSDFIIDNENLEMVQLFKAFKEKHYTHMTEKDVMKSISALPIPTLEITDQFDTIGGYACQVAVARFDDPMYPDVELAFTNEIEVERPNWFHMFNEIDGVLMRFDIYMFDMQMEMEAIRVLDQKVNSSRFDIPDEYKEVTYPELNQKMKGLIDEYL